jgi:hypothetical protein
MANKVSIEEQRLRPIVSAPPAVGQGNRPKRRDGPAGERRFFEFNAERWFV